MKGSEVIKEIEALIKAYGDIHVLDDEGFIINTVKIEEEADNKYIVLSN